MAEELVCCGSCVKKWTVGCIRGGVSLKCIKSVNTTFPAQNMKMFH